MDSQSLSDIHDRLALLLAAGDEQAAREYLAEQYPNLPEDAQRKIALATFIKTMQEDVAERDATTDIQEQGLRTAQALGDGEVGDLDNLTDEHKNA